MEQREKRYIVYGIFIIFGTILYRHASGDDLSSSYIACKLFEYKEISHLYDYDPVLFHIIKSDIWEKTARTAHFLGTMHPYVQTPLWGYSLQPICASINFFWFKIIFLFLSLFSISIMMEITALLWAPQFLSPRLMLCALGCMLFTEPLIYALKLVQTHSIFMALSLLAFSYNQKRRDFCAGGLLSYAASVKITPAFIIIYWIFRGKLKSVFWFFVWSIFIIILTILCVGMNIFFDFINSMSRVSHVLLHAINNQSFSAWASYSTEYNKELLNWKIFEINSDIKMLSTLLMVVFLSFFGYMGRIWKDGTTELASLISITVFSPIAWSHYYIIVFPAILVILNKGGFVNYTICFIVFISNTCVVSVNYWHPIIHKHTILYAELYSAILTIIALIGCRFPLFRAPLNLPRLPLMKR